MSLPVSGTTATSSIKILLEDNGPLWNSLDNHVCQHKGAEQRSCVVQVEGRNQSAEIMMDGSKKAAMFYLISRLCHTTQNSVELR
jgi:hypothetical protein